MTRDIKSISVDPQLRTDMIKIFKRAGLTSRKKFRKAMKQIRWATFIETYFPDPEDMEAIVKLSPWQAEIADVVQTMYYTSKKCRKFPEVCPKHNAEGKIKQYLQVIAPRSRGKSVIIAAINAVIILIESNNSSGIFSPSQQQSENIMSKTKFFIENSRFRKMVLPRGKSISRMQKIFTGAASVGMTNGGFSQAWANNEKTKRGGH